MKDARGRERTCQEASPFDGGDPKYIPCGRPAVAIIDNGDERPYWMCAECAEHNVRNRRGVAYSGKEAALTEQFNRRGETIAEMRKALLLDAAAFARIRARWPHIEIPNANASVKLGAPRTADPGSPVCLRCSIEHEIQGPSQ